MNYSPFTATTAVSEDSIRQIGQSTDIAHSLKEWAQELRALNDATEKDFLFTGEQLGAILAHAQRISDVSIEAASLVNSEEVKKDMEGLSHSLNVLDGFLTGSREDMQRHVRTLGTMLNLLRSAGEPLASFAGVVKHLHILSVATKIESSRIQTVDNSFFLLAEDVEKLSQVIEGRSGEMRAGLSSLKDTVGSTLSNITALKDHEYLETKETLQTAHSILSQLSQKCILSSETARLLGEKSKDIAEAISGIVASLQFHDITRQQIEHVATTLEEVASMNTAEIANSDDVPAMLGRVAELQTEQLSNARDELREAVQKVIGDLQAVSDTVAAMSRDTRTVLGVAADNSSSFLADITTSLGSIFAFFTGNMDREDRAVEALSRVASTISQLSEFANDIDGIGSEIELIALNAQVKAARAQGYGEALGVIAEAIARLSDSAKSRTSVVTEILRSIGDAAGMVAMDEGTESTHDKIGHLTDEIEKLSASARATNQSAISLIRDLERDTGTLTASVREILNGITAHTKVNSIVTSVIERLGTIGETSGPARREVRSERVKEYLDLLSQRYTMVQERRVHRSVFEGRAACDPAEDGLGSNVELF